MVMDAAPTSEATPEVTDAVAAPPVTDTPAAKAPEPDWKVQAEREAEARRAADKRANDARAEAGRAMKAAREAKEEAERQRLLVEKWMSGDITTKEQADDFRAKSTSDATRSSLQAEVKAEVARVRKLTDELGVDPGEDDDFEEAGDYMAEAMDAADAGMAGTARRALKQARRAHDAAVEKAKAKRAPAEPPKAPESAPARRAPTDEDVARTRALEGTVAPPAAGGYASEGAFVDAYLKGQVSVPEYRRVMFTKYGKSV